MALAASISFLVATTGAVMASGRESPDPNARLGVWEGQWTFHGQLFETPYSHAAKPSGTDDCIWVPGKSYMVCDILDETSNPPVSDLSIFSYNRAVRTYTHTVMETDSAPFPETVTIQGSTWLAQTHFSDRGKVVLLRDVYKFISSDRVTEYVTLSDDHGKHWVLRFQGTLVKAHSSRSAR